MNQFSELNLCSALRDNLKRNCFVTPTPVQAEAIPPAMAGRDVVATAQTGTGKTLAFAIPLLEALAAAPRAKTIKALILSPTRELAIQIEEAFANLTPGTRIKTAVVVGGMSEGNQLRAIRAGAEVVIATPGRLCDFLQRRLVDLSKVSTIVLDEADRMLDMGFLPSLRAILKTLPAQRQTMLFSATIETSVAHLIQDYVTNPVRISIGTATKPCEQVDLHLFEIDAHNKLELLTILLKENRGSALVFARTKHGADRLANNLSKSGFKTTRIHGDRSQSQRNQALQGFKDGDYRILVATDVAARGIHVDGISYVVNFDLPQVSEDFIHRVGRTGRAGARGTAWTFATPMERSEIRQIEKGLGLKMKVLDLPAGMPEGSKVVVIPVAPRRARSFSPRRRGFGGR
jgi:ATP-dependent RNA helicase RhlE